MKRILLDNLDLMKLNIIKNRYLFKRDVDVVRFLLTLEMNEILTEVQHDLTRVYEKDDSKKEKIANPAAVYS